MTDEHEIELIKSEDEHEIELIESGDENDLTTFTYISNGLYFEYFVGYEVASLLGYKDTNKLIRNNVSKSNQLIFRNYPGIKDPELDPRVILITRDGAIEILLKTRKRISPDVLHILKKFNIDTTNRKCLTKEQQTLSTITNVFKTEKFEDQFKIGSYYLDLFFTGYKIVIECDENGHADRKPWKERERMDYVNKNLSINDSNWIRFNPDEHDFDIAKVIGRIYRKIDEIKQEEVENEIRKKEEEYQKLLEEERKKKVEVKKKEFRKCKTCKKTKKLTEEFFSFRGTHISNSCKACTRVSGVGNEKPVNQYDMDGNFIRRFDSVKEAASIINTNPNNIARNCRGVIKTTGNFSWRFADPNLYSSEDEDNTEDNVEEDNVEEDNVEDNTEIKTKKKIKIKENSVIKTVAQYNTDGTFIKTYISGHEAARDLKVTPGSIYGAIRNNFVCKGFLWKYVVDGKIIDKIDEVTPHKKYMKQVEVFKDGKLYKNFISIRDAATYMNVNISKVRKFLEGKKDTNNFEWKFKI